MSNNLSNSFSQSNPGTPRTPVNSNNEGSMTYASFVLLTPERTNSNFLPQHDQDLRQQRAQRASERPRLTEASLNRLRIAHNKARAMIMSTTEIPAGCRATSQWFNNLDRNNPGNGGAAAITIKC